jgi:cytochrome P450
VNLANITLDDLTVDPHAALAAARATGSVAWLPAVDGWIVTGRDAAVEVMRDPHRFTVDDPRFTTGQILGPSMLSTDGSDHARHRGPFARWFSDRAELLRLGHWMTEYARRLVAGLQPDGRAELRSSLAAPLAAGTVTHMLRLETAGAAALLRWYAEIVAGVHNLAVGDAAGESATQAHRDLSAAIAAVSRTEPPALLIDALGVLSADEIVANAAVILFGGIETAEGATANAIWHLLTNPAALDAVQADRSLVGTAVEESLRLEPAAASIDRYATTDTELFGASIRAGDYVVVSLAGANRDPAVFANPDQFDLGRSNLRAHTTFALGPHACLGIHLARSQAIAGIGALLDGLDSIRLGDDADGPLGLVFRKPASLDATWVPR